MPARHALPLYLQIAEMIIRDINAGRLSDGARLPPERDYAADLKVSVGTLRKALEHLVQKGLIERIHGSGNYIRAKADVESVYAFFRVELLEGGGLPTAELLGVKKCTKPGDLPDFGLSDEAWRIRRLRRLNGRAAVLEEIWLDASCAAQLRARDLSESLYLTYREKLSLWITRAEDRLSIAPVPGWAPEVFGLASGAHSLLATRISYSREGQAVEVSRGYIDTSIATYVARLK